MPRVLLLLLPRRLPFCTSQPSCPAAAGPAACCTAAEERCCQAGEAAGRLAGGEGVRCAGERDLQPEQCFCHLPQKRTKRQACSSANELGAIPKISHDIEWQSLQHSRHGQVHTARASYFRQHASLYKVCMHACFVHGAGDGSRTGGRRGNVASWRGCYFAVRCILHSRPHPCCPAAWQLSWPCASPCASPSSLSPWPPDSAAPSAASLGVLSSQEHIQEGILVSRAAKCLCWSGIWTRGKISIGSWQPLMNNLSLGKHSYLSLLLAQTYGS